MVSSLKQARPKAGLRLYIDRQASGLGRYVLEQSLYLLLGWVPTVSLRDGLVPMIDAIRHELAL